MDAIKEEIQKSDIIDKKNKGILVEMYEYSLLEISDLELEKQFNKLLEKNT